MFYSKFLGIAMIASSLATPLAAFGDELGPVPLARVDVSGTGSADLHVFVVGVTDPNCRDGQTGHSKFTISPTEPRYRELVALSLAAFVNNLPVSVTFTSRALDCRLTGIILQK